MSNQTEKQTGVVTEKLPNAEFRVQKEDGSIIRCYLAGKLKINKIKVDVHDTVYFVADQYGHIGRIVWVKRIY